MAFWKREEKTEREECQRTKKRRGEAGAGERPTASEEFMAYFKTVRQAQFPESGEPGQPGEQASPLQTFLSRLRPEDQGREPEAPPEKCPWCGGEMERGYLSCGGGKICWTRKKPGLVFGTMFTGEETLLLNDPGDSYKISRYCPKCKKLTVDVSEAGEVPEAGRQTMAPPQDGETARSGPGEAAGQTPENQEET